MHRVETDGGELRQLGRRRVVQLHRPHLTSQEAVKDEGNAVVGGLARVAEHADDLRKRKDGELVRRKRGRRR